MLEIFAVTPTIFFRYTTSGLMRLVRLTVRTDHPAERAMLRVRLEDGWENSASVDVLQGEYQQEAFIPDIQAQCRASFVLEAGQERTYAEILLTPQRKWVVHVVQTSHHDPGYTDLPSLVLRQHDEYLDEAIDLAQATGDYPEDARFRIVIEQAWSADHFLKRMPKDRTAKLIELMRAGQFELTALFGNMTTELCGHEGLARAAYHAFAIKREYGVPIISAEHNDITGVSWGLSRVLTDAGIKFFCPGIPLYYDWAKNIGMQSFWDQQKIFGHDGPGAFWWESPAGKKVLFWCNNTGCGGPCQSTLPGLVEKLELYEQQGYPWPVLRWPVSGGQRDNSPYSGGYASTIRVWNEQWAYPRLVCSTNAKFYGELAAQDLRVLPTWRGELPGQDYPSGATSTAAATAINRNAHSSYICAEKLASVAAFHTGYRYPQDILSEACEETLWHDEHAWGFHFPCGPAMEASILEKSLHAYRAQALAHGVANKAMARIADSLPLADGYHLIVFNTTSWSCTAPVRALLREYDNSGSEMQLVPPDKNEEGVSYLRGYVLGHRFHTVLPQEMIDGRFELVDADTGEPVESQIVEISSAMDPQPDSAQRLGLGSGSKRLGLFEEPIGVKRNLCFVAHDVPAMGYRAYRLVSRKEERGQASAVSGVGSWTIDNEYYRVTVNEHGSVVSIRDKETDRELVDASCEHGFFRLLVRQGNLTAALLDECLGVEAEAGPVLSTILISSRICGHPAVQKRVTLYRGVKQIFLDIKVQKDSTPLLNAHVGFPFAVERPQFRYEGSLSVMQPILDYLPGAYSDTISVQNWVKVGNDAHCMLWSSLDAPIVSLGRLWPGYVSPAHRCLLDESAAHAPQTPEDMKNGWVYSQLCHNNFGTNFSVTQCGEMLFRYVLSSVPGDLPDAAAARFGWQAMSPLTHILTDRRIAHQPLGLSGCFVKLDNDDVVIVNLKKAEDGRGFLLRLWNLTDSEQTVQPNFPGMEKMEAVLTNICEEDIQPVACEGSRLSLKIAPRDLVTLRIAITRFPG